MGYTKGEWLFGHNIGVYSGNTHIADIIDVENGFDETLANARLISASPDLLEACKQLFFAPHQEHFISSLNEEEMKGMKMIRDAIIKATGTI